MKIRNVALLALVSAMLMGCITEGNVETKLAKTYCDRYEECDRGDFEEDFTSRNDCVETTADGDLFECFEEAGCEFQPDKAAECRRAAASATCQEFTSGDYLEDGNCDEIYDCTDSQAVEAGACALGF